jgi:hypothetical protein
MIDQLANRAALRSSMLTIFVIIPMNRPAPEGLGKRVNAIK